MNTTYEFDFHVPAELDLCKKNNFFIPVRLTLLTICEGKPTFTTEFKAMPASSILRISSNVNEVLRKIEMLGTDYFTDNADGFSMVNLDAHSSLLVPLS